MDNTLADQLILKFKYIILSTEKREIRALDARAKIAPARIILIAL
jgi:hypothetical protein